MAYGDLTKVATNLQSLSSLNSLRQTNDELGIRQLRLSTGSRLNRAEDDSAGYIISSKLQARVRGQAQALANVGDAKSLLTVGEGSLNTVMDILMTMKEKVVQAANDTLASAERTAIKSQLDALSGEVTDILGDTKFNNTSVFTSTAFSFQVNADAGDTFAYAQMDPAVAAAKVEAEQRAADRLFGLLPAATGAYFRDLWDDYEAGGTPEARFVMAVDRSAPMLLNITEGGSAWREHGITREKVIARNGRHVEPAIPALWAELLARLDAAVAQGAIPEV